MLIAVRDSARSAGVTPSERRVAAVIYGTATRRSGCNDFRVRALSRTAMNA
ncbi:MAG: hypothetical protein LBL94_09930 [Prevotellaceae bacterium]|nr:hypothetical protein [Prevotellaceae bacterium]